MEKYKGYTIKSTAIKYLVHPIEELTVPIREVHEYIQTSFSPSFDLYYPTNVMAIHLAKREWNLFMAVRELIQNALDEEEYVQGPGIEIKKEKDHILISDHGRGVSLEAFRIGSEEKECWQRGRYGEGIKASFAHLVITAGYDCYVIANDLIFRPIDVSGMLYILIGKIKKHVKGTSIYIFETPRSEKIDAIKDLIKDITYIKIQDKLINVVEGDGSVTTETCNYLRPFSIFDVPNQLFVGDIYVNEFDKIVAFPSLFSYNLWYVALKENRISVFNPYQLRLAVEYVLNNSYDKEIILSKIASALIDFKKKEINYKTRYYEIEYPKPSKKLEEKLGEYITNKLGPTVVVNSDTTAKIIKYKSPGVNVLLVTDSDVEKWLKGVKAGTDVLFEEALKMLALAEKHATVPSMLNYMQNSNLCLFYAIFIGSGEDIKERVEKIKITSADIGTTLAYFDPRTENITVSIRALNYKPQTIQSAFEETAHYNGYVVHHQKASDISRELEDRMVELARDILSNDYILSSIELTKKSAFLIFEDTVPHKLYVLRHIIESKPKLKYYWPEKITAFVEDVLGLDMMTSEYIADRIIRIIKEREKIPHVIMIEVLIKKNIQIKIVDYNFHDKLKDLPVGELLIDKYIKLCKEVYQRKPPIRNKRMYLFYNYSTFEYLLWPTFDIKKMKT